MTASKTKSTNNDASQAERRTGFWRGLWRLFNAHRERKLFAFVLAFIVWAAMNFNFEDSINVGRWNDVEVGIEVVNNVKGPYEYYFKSVTPSRAIVAITVLDNNLDRKNININGRIILNEPLICDEVNEYGKCSHFNSPHITTKTLNREDFEKPAQVKIRGIKPVHLNDEDALRQHSKVKDEIEVKIVWDEIDNKKVKVIPRYIASDSSKAVSVKIDETAIIRGPKYLLAKINAVETEKIEINENGNFERKAEVKLPDKISGDNDAVKLVTQDVTMYVSVADSTDVELRAFQNLRIHYLVNQNDSGRLQVTNKDADKDTVDIVVKVPIKQKQPVNSQSIIAYCDLTGFPQEDATRKVKVQFILPPGVEIKEGSAPPPVRLKLEWINK